VETAKEFLKNFSSYKGKPDPEGEKRNRSHLPIAHIPENKGNSLEDNSWNALKADRI